MPSLRFQLNENELKIQEAQAELREERALLAFLKKHQHVPEELGLDPGASAEEVIKAIKKYLAQLNAAKARMGGQR